MSLRSFPLTSPDFFFNYLEKTDKTVFAAMDKTGKIIDCNKAFLSVMGIKENHLNLNFYDLIADSEKDFPELSDSDGITLVFKKSHKDCSVLKCYFYNLADRIIMLAESPHLTGDKIIEKISVLNQQMADMSRELDRKNRKLNTLLQEKRESEQRIRTLLNASSEAIVLITPDGLIVEINEVFSRLFQIKTIIDLNSAINTYLHTDVKDYFDSALAEVLKTNDIFSGEVISDDKYIQLRLFPVIITPGEISNIACFFSDITQRKKLESLAIETSRLDMAEKMTSGVAHDINNMLMGLSANLQILEMKIKEEKYLKRITLSREIVSRTADLIEQMLSFTQGINLEFEKIDISNIVENVLKMNISGKNSNINAVFKKHPSPIIIKADPRLLKSALYQILQNAYEAAGDCGLISIETLLANGGDKAEIIIKDNGIGIPDEIINKIFDPFFSTKFLGRGMGLSAVMGIIKSHNGSIEIKSSTGKDNTLLKGTEVRISLPYIR